MRFDVESLIETTAKKFQSALVSKSLKTLANLRIDKAIGWISTLQLIRVIQHVGEAEETILFAYDLEHEGLPGCRWSRHRTRVSRAAARVPERVPA